MTPNLREVPIMEYVRQMEKKCRELEAQQGRLDMRVFLWGFVAGIISSVGIVWYVLHH